MYEKVIDGIWRIRGKRSNIYLVEGNGLTIIDTGMPGDDRVILEALGMLGHAPADVRAVCITHAHLDHVGSLAAVKAATGAAVVAGVREKEYIEGRKMLCSMRREGMGGALFRGVLFVLEACLQKYYPSQVDRAVGEGGGDAGGLQALATPGHSPGSLSFYDPAKRALFTGDALSARPSLRLPVRAGCADYRRALLSARALGELKVDVCLCGHGDPVLPRAGERIRELSAPAGPRAALA